MSKKDRAEKDYFEVLKEKIFNKNGKINLIFTKLSETHALLIPILSSLFAFAYWGFNFFYETNCTTYYGVTLKCFNSDVYQFRWFVVIVLVVFSFLYILLIKIFIKKPTMKFDFVLDCVIQGILLSTVNLLSLLLIVSIPLDNGIVNWIYSHQTITLWILFIFSFALSIILALIVRMDLIVQKLGSFVKMAAIILVAFQVSFFACFVIIYASPNPENITQYTVVTVETENDKNNSIENYIVIGTYEGDFVCEKIISCNGNADYLDNENDYNLDSSDIKVKKYEYKILSSDEIIFFRTINFHSVNLVQ